MEPLGVLKHLAKILERRKQAPSRPYNLLLTSALSLTPTMLQNICHSENWSVFHQYIHNLGQRDRLHALSPLLQTSQYSDGYRALARLITRQYFSTILTTNIDSALENALEAILAEEGLPSRSFQVLIPERDSDEYVVRALDDHTNGVRIVKLHGSLREGVIPITFPDFFEPHYGIQESVKRYLNQDLIIIGSIDHEDHIDRALTRYG
ncbi:MAG TPA: SIR2 family protein, partial [Ktedonobacteraceae bacterium]|nr:SIR2 family protein [Ktedonobacteraceae bacterium]